jgi:hypothetical protein
MTTLLDEMIAPRCAMAVIGGYETPSAQCCEKGCERAIPYDSVLLLTAAHFRGSSQGHSSHEVRFD